MTCGPVTGGDGLYFDKVGGAHLEAALATLRNQGRLVAGGPISTYNDGVPSRFPDLACHFDVDVVGPMFATTRTRSTPAR